MEMKSGGHCGSKTNGLAAEIKSNGSLSGLAHAHENSNSNSKRECRLSAVDLLAVEADGKIRSRIQDSIQPDHVTSQLHENR